MNTHTGPVSGKKLHVTGDDMCTTQKLEVKRIVDFFGANGWVMVVSPEEADMIIVPMCSGFKELEENTFRRLHELRRFADKTVAVGCTKTVNPERLRRFHQGCVIGTQELQEIATLLPDAKVRLDDISEPSTFKSSEDYRLYDLTKRFVNISAGCAFNCFYCPHKAGIGGVRSRRPEDIVAQVKELVREGVRTVVLTGLDTAFYGRDIGATYPDLLKMVLNADPCFEVHVAQHHPMSLKIYGKQLLSLFANCRVTDIQVPIQTTSERLLRLLGRPVGLNETVRNLLVEVRKQNPIAVLRTDVMVGIPTETEEEIIESLDYATAVFDEVCVYALEVREELPLYGRLKKRGIKLITQKELDKRTVFAREYIEKKGCMAHGGQQDKVDLKDVEKRKQEIRDAKRKIAAAAG